MGGMSASPATGRPAANPGGHRERLLAGAVACMRDKGYAHTTARDLVAASGTNLKSIGYHFGGKEALLDEALGQCFKEWTARVEQAVFGAPTDRPGSGQDRADGEGAADTPRDILERALVALIDGFDQLRPVLVSCVEAYAPALRSTVLRDKLAAAYAQSRQAGADMVRRACADLGIDPPFDPEAFVSVLIAICDGLMLQWLTDPEATPDARQTLDVLAGLSFLAAPSTGSGFSLGLRRSGGTDGQEPSSAIPRA
jgi:AcrR family transcriptional regulator